MHTISGIIIAKNEEEMIADCMDTLSFCDEVIVIDDHSTDRTAEIARFKNAQVFSRKFTSFAQRRNFGLSKAKSEWVLYLDADERVDRELITNIKKIISESDSNCSAFRLNRKNFYLGNNEWPVVEQLERLFRRKSLKGWYGDLHESPRIDGDTGSLSGHILHYTHRDLRTMLEKTNNWSDIEARLRYEKGHPKVSWWRLYRVILTAFINSYIKQKGYKLGIVGLIESIFQSYSMFITYAKLWEMQIVQPVR